MATRIRSIARALATSTHATSWLVAGVVSTTLVGVGCSSKPVAPPDEPAATATAPQNGHLGQVSRVLLPGNTHPLAAVSEYDVGKIDDSAVLEHMQLVLKRSPEQEAAVVAHIDALHDKTSPQYQQWMTAEQYGAQYGVPQADVDRVTGWLESKGLHVDSVPVSRMFVEFTGTAAQVSAAFDTEIHGLQVEGVRHFANVRDPSIPASLAHVVVGVHALHDFMPHALHRDLGSVTRNGSTGRWSKPTAMPEFNTVISGSTFNAVSPADFATIYNLNPLFAEGITGLGQKVVVIEDTTILNAGDVTAFRTAFGLGGYKGTFTQGTVSGTTTCTASGVNAAEGEAALDAEWAAATAPDAAIQLASCKDTTTVFGGLIALQNLLNGASPPQIVSISYGECESLNGAAANTSYVNTYQQAAALGVSVFVAAGDQGAAVCDANKAAATSGIAVSGFASTPYNVAVGGTDFIDTYSSLTGGAATSTYWAAANGPTLGSARSYIPEIPWNNSCAGKLLYTFEGFTQAYGATGFCNSTAGANFRTTGAGSGGPSTFSNQPSWQTGVPGLPTKSGGKRYLPDVSLFAANGLWNHFYVFCMSDAAQGGVTCDYNNASDVASLAAGGTSFAAPAFAGIQALINQKMGAAQGNPNPTLYKLAAAEFGGRGVARCNGSSPQLPAGNCIFNDVTQGDIDVNCTAGTPNCFGATRGVLSVSTTTLTPAYVAGPGWDFATGLGTVNAYNLVTAWSK